MNSHQVCRHAQRVQAPDSVCDRWAGKWSGGGEKRLGADLGEGSLRGWGAGWLHSPTMNEPTKITREELYERIWKMPATKLAKELGISDVALAKICRKLNVPKPGPGHWRLVQLGWEIERPALPALGKNAAVEAIIDPEAHRTGRSDLAGVGADGKQKSQFEVVPVPETLHGAHPLISRMKRLFEAEKPGWGGIVEVPWRLSVMEISVSKAQTPEWPGEIVR